ncbi:hypothetical protein ACC671_10810 [Rhizobium ruizarguesonis]
MVGSSFSIFYVLYPFLLLGLFIGLGLFGLSFVTNRAVEARIGLAPRFKTTVLPSVLLVALLVAVAFGWLQLSWFTNKRLAQASIHKIPEITGITSPETAASDPSLVNAWIDQHDIEVEPGRTNKPALVRYKWTAPAVAHGLPSMAAAYLASFNGKEVEIIPGIACEAQQKNGAVATCARPQSGTRTFVFEWFINAKTTVDIVLDISLGAIAVDGKFKAERCIDNGTDIVCTDFGEREDWLFKPGSNGLSILYGTGGKPEKLNADRDKQTTSSDRHVSVDATNARIRLTFPITYPSGITEPEWNLITFGGTAFSALFGSGVFFAAYAIWEKRRGERDGTGPQPSRPAYSKGRKVPRRPWLRL